MSHPEFFWGLKNPVCPQANGGSAEGSRPLPGFGVSPNISSSSLAAAGGEKKKKNGSGDTPRPGRENPAPQAASTFSKVWDDS